MTKRQVIFHSAFAFRLSTKETQQDVALTSQSVRVRRRPQIRARLPRFRVPCAEHQGAHPGVWVSLKLRATTKQALVPFPPPRWDSEAQSQETAPPGSQARRQGPGLRKEGLEVMSAINN